MSQMGEFVAFIRALAILSTEKSTSFDDAQQYRLWVKHESHEIELCVKTDAKYSIITEA